MKSKLSVLTIILLTFAVFTACKADTTQPEPKTTYTPIPAQPSPTETPQTGPVPTAVQPAQPQQAAAGHQGTVLESMDSGGYTYIQVDTGSEKIWAASNQFQVKVGDEVIVPQGTPMKNFHSKTLDRTFETIYFVSTITAAGAETTANQPDEEDQDHDDHEGHQHADTSKLAPPDPVPSTTDFSGIVKAKGGNTVAEVFGDKNNLSGKNVSIRGKVVKFSPGIMGKNWIHLQDGTGAEGTNDLTVTTNDMAQKGDTVLINGAVTVDKDFGAGYKYDVIIEDAKVTVE